MKTPPESRRGWMPWAIGWGAVAAALGVFLLVSDTPDEIGEAIAAREAAGKHAQPEQTMALALWWGALANVPLALLMAAGAKLWARALPAPKGGANWREGTRAAWLAIGVIAVLAGGLRWNLAGRSLWWDELWSAQHAVVGYYLGKPDDPVDGRYFAKPSPARAMWFYTKPTNHAVASVPAQLSHRIWRAATKPARPELFSDRALRFPTWLASIAAVLAVGWLGVRWGGPWAGVCAALLLAGHPWHIRMGVDMRAYSYLVLWAALGCAVLTRLLDKRHGASWGAWWAFGAVQFLLVWSFLHATPVALAFFAVAAFAIPRNWQPREARLTAFSRLVAVNVAAAMAYLFLFAPNVAQMPVWVPKELDRNHGHSLTAGRALETATDLFTGMPLKLAEMRETRGLADFASRPAALRWVAGVLFAGAALAGAWWLWKRRRDWAWSVSDCSWRRRASRRPCGGRRAITIRVSWCICWRRCRC